MPATYTVKSKKSGKSYDMTWDKPEPPTSLEAKQYIWEQENPSILTRAKNLGGEAWAGAKKAATPNPKEMDAFGLPKPWGEKTDAALDKPFVPPDETEPDTWMGGFGKGLFNEYISPMTTPRSIAQTALTGKTALKAARRFGAPAALPDIAPAPLGPERGPAGMQPYKNPNLGTNKPGWTEGQFSEIPDASSSMALPPKPTRLALPPAPNTFYGGRQGLGRGLMDMAEGPVYPKSPAEASFNALIPERYKPGPSNTGTTGSFPYVRPPNDIPSLGAGGLPDIPTPVTPGSVTSRSPKPPASTLNRVYARASDSDVEFLAKQGDKAAIAEGVLRPTLRERLAYLIEDETGSVGPGNAQKMQEFLKKRRQPIEDFYEQNPGARTGGEGRQTGQFAEGSGGLADLTAGKMKPYPMPSAGRAIPPTTLPDLMDEFQAQPATPKGFDWPEAGGRYEADALGSHKLQPESPDLRFDPRESMLRNPVSPLDMPLGPVAESKGVMRETLDAFGKPKVKTRPFGDRVGVEPEPKKYLGDDPKRSGERGSFSRKPIPDEPDFDPKNDPVIRKKANKIQAKDWSTRREAAKVHAEFAVDDFKDLAGKEDLIDKFQAGDRTGRLADVAKLFDNLYETEKAAGLKMTKKENYLRQLYSDLVDDTTPAVQGGVVPKHPSFTKKSTYATYKEARAAGMTPRFNDLPGIIGERVRESKVAIANKQFDDYLNKTGQKQPKMTIKEPTQLHFSGPHSKQLGKYTENVLGGGWKPQVVTGQIVSKLKNVYLAGGIPFTPLNIHGWNIGRSAYMARGVKGIKTFARSIVNPAHNVRYLKSEKELIRKAIDYGYSAKTENIATDELTDLLNKSMVGRGVNKAFSIGEKMFEKPLFDVYLPAEKARILRQVYDEMLPKVGEEAALRQASDIANDFMGGINKSLRNKNGKSLLQIIALAPDWAESRINLAVKGAKSIAGKEHPLYAKGLARAAAMRGAGAAAGAGTAAYGATRGDKPSDLTSIGLGKTESGKIREFPILGTAAEALRIPEESIRGFMQGDLSPMVRLLRNRLSQPAQSAIGLMFNMDAFGNPLSGKTKYDEEITKEQALFNFLNVASQSLQPQQLQSLVGFMEGKQGLEESVVQGLELPLRYSTIREEPGRRSRSRSR